MDSLCESPLSIIYPNVNYTYPLAQQLYPQEITFSKNTAWIFYEYEQNISHLNTQMSTDGIVLRGRNKTCEDGISTQNDLKMLEDWRVLMT